MHQRDAVSLRTVLLMDCQGKALKHNNTILCVLSLCFSEFESLMLLYCQLGFGRQFLLHTHFRG